MDGLYYTGGIARYTIDNLVIGNLPATTTKEIAVTLPGAALGDIGIACPREAIFTAGIIINPVRISAANTGQIPFVNASPGAIFPPQQDTHDFTIVLFKANGAVGVAT